MVAGLASSASSRKLEEEEEEIGSNATELLIWFPPKGELAVYPSQLLLLLLLLP